MPIIASQVNRVNDAEIDTIQTNKSVGFTLTTLAPVAVKSEEQELSPLADFILDDGKIAYIDPTKFMALLEEQNCIDDYGNFVAEIGNNESREGEKEMAFRSFMQKHNIDVQSIIASRRRLSRIENANLVQIQRHIHSAGRIYIPGSTLKGAINSALFYSWFSRQDQYKQEIERQVSLFSKPKDGLKMLNRLIEKQFKEYLELNETYCYNTLWGVRDTSLLSKHSENVGVIQLNRVKLTPGESAKSSIPILIEAINEGTPFTGEFILQDSKLLKDAPSFNNKMKRLNSDFIDRESKSGVIQKINSFARSFIDHQLEFLKLKGLGSASGGMEKYIDQLYKMQNQLKKLKKNQAILCLGFGKSILQNTTLMLLDKATRKTILDWNKPDRKSVEDAPITMFQTIHNESLGWCLLEFEKQAKESLADNEKIEVGMEFEVEVIAPFLPKGHLTVEYVFNGMKHQTQMTGKQARRDGISLGDRVLVKVMSCRENKISSVSYQEIL